MIPRFNRNDLRVIAHYLGLLIMLFGMIMLAPLLVSLIYAEWDIACHYAFGIGLSLAVGSLLRLAKIDPQRMKRGHAIAITGSLWIVGAVFAAVPLYLSGHYASFLDAVFEGVSGLTATGLSLVQDVDHLSMGDNMWRFTMQFVGGQGVIVVALSLGLFSRTGSSLYTSEGRDEAVVPNVMNTARFIWKFAIAAVLIGTVVMSVILFLNGMDPARGFFHALWITIGAYDTGGFAAGSLSLIAYHSWALEIVAMLLMLFGALSFALVAQIHKGNWREFIKDIEVRTLALWTVLMVVIFVAAIGAGEFLASYSGMARRGIFTIISATTNTGFQVLTNEQFTALLSSGAFFLIAVSMAVGGSSASTAGGIKALRVGLIIKGIGLQVRKILQPRSAQITTNYNHIGKHQLTSELLSAAMIIAALYMLSYIIGALAGVAYGYEALDAIFESISAGSNAGLSSGIIQPDMPVALEVLYILQMWLGRLEFITLLGLFATLLASVIPRRKPKQQHFSLKDKLEGQKKNIDREAIITSKNEPSHKDADAQKQSKKDTGTKGRVQPLSVVVIAAVVGIVLAATFLLAPLQTAFAENDSPATTATTVDTNPRINTQTDAVAKDLADSYTISELAAVPKELDGTNVQFTGEVVCNIMNAGPDHVWLTMSDGASAISVFLPDDMQSSIEHVGTYASEGTSLSLRGEFHTGCAEHEWLNDVHVTEVVEVVSSGKTIEHAVNYTSLILGLILAALGGVLSAVYYYLRQRER